MTDPFTVLVVDDEPPIRRFLRASLAAHGYRVVEAGTGGEALDRERCGALDVVILDLGLPDIDGFQVLETVRRHSTVPIIVLSSRDDEKGKVKALDLGADDYVTKPFGMEELIARVRAALRHRFQRSGEHAVYRNGGLVVDLVRRVVTVEGRPVKLSRKEYDLLGVLVAHAGKVLTHQFLLRKVWQAPIDVQYLRIYIKQLRRKIEPNPQEPRYILTELGVGYRLHEQD